MTRRPSDTVALFETEDLWQRFTQNPHLEERTRVVLSMLPAGVRSVLDVGCGNGVLVRALASTRSAVGIDPSVRGLREFDSPRACAVGEHLPFRDGSFDAATCLEVLEHLTDEGVRACAAEIRRVARRWLIVATPDDEDPRRNALRCPRCGAVFNRSHHLQRFDARRLSALFPDFAVHETRRAGQMVRPVPSPILWLRHHIARSYFKGPGETTGLCPRCGNREFPPFVHNPLTIFLDGLNRLISRRRPYWVLVLLERESRGSIESAP